MKRLLLAIFGRGASARRSRRMTLVLGGFISLVVGLGGGTAYAFFTSSGSGSGSGTAGSPLSVTVIEATGSAVNQLYPGASGDLLVKLNNPNSFPLTIVSVSGNCAVTGAGGT